MKLKVFAIHDVKGQVYANPFYMAHDGQALRAFSDLVGDEKSMVNKHPEDYKLYGLGDFDDVSGRFDSYDVPKFLANATDFQSK